MILTVIPLSYTFAFKLISDMQPNKKSLFVPVLLIALGAGWLLTTLGVVPEVNWIWTIALAVLGILTFIISGFDKVSLVIGGFLIVASLLSVLRQTDRLNIDHELPILVIVTGCLLLAARASRVPIPDWYEVPVEK